MKTNIILTAVFSLVLSFSFADGPAAKKINSKEFSACCEGNLSLSLRADNTFSYVNTMNNYYPVNVEGQWYFNEGEIHLIHEGEDKVVPKTWKIDRSSGCLIANMYGSDFLQLCDDSAE